jgi:hypothetical protein
MHNYNPPPMGKTAYWQASAQLLWFDISQLIASMHQNKYKKFRTSVSVRQVNNYRALMSLDREVAI